MLKIRLARVGKINQPLYRIVINEKRKDPWGDVMEILGQYNSRTKVAELKLDRIKYWISQGAEVSDTLWNLFISKGVVEGKKRNVTSISKIHGEKLKAKADAAAAKEKVAAPAPTPEAPQA